MPEVGNFVHGADATGRIQIDKIVYESILTCIGYPIMEPSDMGISDEDVKRLYIREAMEEFWTRFPIEVHEEYTAAPGIEIPFPDDNTFGVVQARINHNIYDGVRTASPFFNAMSVTNRSMDYRAFGTPFDYGMRQVLPGRSAEIAGQTQFLKSVKLHIEDRKVRGYSNLSGRLYIVWAKKSYNWNDIPFNFQNDVERMAQAKILRGIGMLKKQFASSDIPVEIDADAFLDRAEELEEFVWERWNGIPKIAIIR